MEKLVQLDGMQIGLKATALTPRLYRFKMGRDMIVDLNALKKSFDKANKHKTDDDKAELSVEDLTIFENVAFVMARQYNPSVPATIDEWLDSLERVFTIYELLPHILELWGMNQQTTAVPKKK